MMQCVIFARSMNVTRSQITRAGLLGLLLVFSVTAVASADEPAQLDQASVLKKVDEHLSTFQRRIRTHELFERGRAGLLNPETVTELAYAQWLDSNMWVPMLALMKDQVKNPRLKRAIIENIQCEAGVFGTSHVELARRFAESVGAASAQPGFERPDIAETARQVTSFTEAEIAGWLYAAEMLVPDLFKNMRPLYEGRKGARLAYLDEHIKVDADEHAKWMREAIAEIATTPEKYAEVIAGIHWGGREALLVPDLLSAKDKDKGKVVAPVAPATIVETPAEAAASISQVIAKSGLDPKTEAEIRKVLREAETRANDLAPRAGLAFARDSLKFQMAIAIRDALFSAVGSAGGEGGKNLFDPAAYADYAGMGVSMAATQRVGAALTTNSGPALKWLTTRVGSPVVAMEIYGFLKESISTSEPIDAILNRHLSAKNLEHLLVLQGSFLGANALKAGATRALELSPKAKRLIQLLRQVRNGAAVVQTGQAALGPAGFALAVVEEAAIWTAASLLEKPVIGWIEEGEQLKKIHAAHSAILQALHKRSGDPELVAEVVLRAHIDIFEAQRDFVKRGFYEKQREQELERQKTIFAFFQRRFGANRNIDADHVFRAASWDAKYEKSRVPGPLEKGVNDAIAAAQSSAAALLDSVGAPRRGLSWGEKPAQIDAFAWEKNQVPEWLAIKSRFGLTPLEAALVMHQVSDTPIQGSERSTVRLRDALLNVVMDRAGFLKQVPAENPNPREIRLEEWKAGFLPEKLRYTAYALDQYEGYRNADEAELQKVLDRVAGDRTEIQPWEKWRIDWNSPKITVYVERGGHRSIVWESLVDEALRIPKTLAEVDKHEALYLRLLPELEAANRSEMIDTSKRTKYTVAIDENLKRRFEAERSAISSLR